MGEDELEEDNGYEGEEEGEMEMDYGDESGEFEQSDEECPDLVPANAKKADLKSNSDVSDIDVDDYGTSSSSEYDSDILDQHTVENPHGFMYGSMLETFTKGRKERIAEL